MAILADRPHYATAVAKTDGKLIALDQTRFQFLVERNCPWEVRGEIPGFC